MVATPYHEPCAQGFRLPKHVAPSELLKQRLYTTLLLLYTTLLFQTQTTVSTENDAISEIQQIQKLKILGFSQYKIKLRLGFNLNLY